MCLPVEQGLLGGSQFLRHKTQLQERFQAVLKPGVNHPVQIGEAIPLLFFSKGRSPFLVYSHLIAEQAVSADMAEMAFFLYRGHLLLVFAVKRQVQPAGTDTVVCQVPEMRGIPRMNDDLFLHMPPPFCVIDDSVSQYIPAEAI